VTPMPLLILCAFLIGVGLPVQSGLNAQLRLGVGQPLIAAAISFLVGTTALVGLNIALRVPLPAGEAVAKIPFSHWLGGLLGAAYIYAAVVLAPRLGAATLIAATVAGQMVASVILDQYGLLGFPTQPLSTGRAAGVLLVIGGVLLIQRR
jgi:transporter family-2 protein